MASFTNQQIDDAVPPASPDTTPHPEEPNRTLTNQLFKSVLADINTLLGRRDNTANDNRYARLAGGANANFTNMPQVGSSPVVESGENANGSWVKWADGTMWCRTSTVQISGGSGSRSSATAAWPQNFASAPRMAGAITDSAVYGSTVSGVNATSCTKSDVEISVYRSNSTGTICQAETIGRWK